MLPPTGLWTDPAGDAAPGFLDLVEGTLSCGDGFLTFELSVPDLDLEAADRISSYYVHRVAWESAGTSYFADAAFGYSRGNPHRVAFFDGVFLPDGTAVLHHEITGSITEGEGGGVTIEVPVANVGIAAASELQDIRGESLDYPFYAYHLGSPTPQGRGSSVDHAGHAAVSYSDQGCSTAVE